MSYKNRYNYNRAIVQILSELVEELPEHRFSQLLFQLEIGEPIHLSETHLEIHPHTESKKTFERLLQSPLVRKTDSYKALRILFSKDNDADNAKR